MRLRARKSYLVTPTQGNRITAAGIHPLRYTMAAPYRSSIPRLTAAGAADSTARLRTPKYRGTETMTATERSSAYSLYFVITAHRHYIRGSGCALPPNGYTITSIHDCL